MQAFERVEIFELCKIFQSLLIIKLLLAFLKTKTSKFKSFCQNLQFDVKISEIESQINL